VVLFLWGLQESGCLFKKQSSRAALGFEIGQGADFKGELFSRWNTLNWKSFSRVG